MVKSMKFEELNLGNSTPVFNYTLGDVKNLMVLVGQNGVGKSLVLKLMTYGIFLGAYKLARGLEEARFIEDLIFGKEIFNTKKWKGKYSVEVKGEDGKYNTITVEFFEGTYEVTYDLVSEVIAPPMYITAAIRQPLVLLGVIRSIKANSTDVGEEYAFEDIMSAGKVIGWMERSPNNIDLSGLISSFEEVEGDFVSEIFSEGDTIYVKTVSGEKRRLSSLGGATASIAIMGLLQNI